MTQTLEYAEIVEVILPESDVMDRVQRGRTLLTTLWPGWEHRIDVEALYLSSSNACILGQLCGKFYAFYPRYHDDDGESYLHAVAHGFVGTGSTFRDAFKDADTLTECWRIVIEQSLKL